MAVQLKDNVCCGTHYAGNISSLHHCAYRSKCPFYAEYRKRNETGVLHVAKNIIQFTRVAEFRYCYKVTHQIFKK